jgi:hypothetical protein
MKVAVLVLCLAGAAVARLSLEEELEVHAKEITLARQAARDGKVVKVHTST